MGLRGRVAYILVTRRMPRQARGQTCTHTRAQLRLASNVSSRLEPRGGYWYSRIPYSRDHDARDFCTRCNTQATLAIRVYAHGPAAAVYIDIAHWPGPLTVAMLRYVRSDPPDCR